MGKHDGANFFWVSGLIFGCFAAWLFMAGVLESEAAAWIGGWFFLFLGLPLFVTAVFCLIKGLILRRAFKRPPPLPGTPESKPDSRTLKMGGGFALMCWGIIVAFEGTQSIFDHFSKLTDGTSRWHKQMGRVRCNADPPQPASVDWWCGGVLGTALLAQRSPDSHKLTEFWKTGRFYTA